MSWWSKLFERSSNRPGARAVEPAHRVFFDDRTITIESPGEVAETLAWTELGNVDVITTGGGPFAIDLFWVLTDRASRRPPVVVPMGAGGEREFIHAMQERLPGFDNMSVIEAMSSVGEARFAIWDSGRREKGPAA